MPILGIVASSKDVVFPPILRTSSEVYTATKTRTYTFECIGAGGGAALFTNGGGSGFYTTGTIFLNIGETVNITIGAGSAGNGGTTSVVRGGNNISASGGFAGTGQGSGGSGGSGGGASAQSDGNYAAFGGYLGSNGQNNTVNNYPGGGGASNVAYGLGNNQNFPPGGSGSYRGSNGITWGGIKGFGGGLGAATNENGIVRGGGAGGTTWAQGTRAGQAGMVVIS